MGKRGPCCKVCSNPGRALIDQQLKSGGSLSEISAAYNLSVSSLFRHRTNCLKIVPRLLKPEAEIPLIDHVGSETYRIMLSNAMELYHYYEAHKNTMEPEKEMKFRRLLEAIAILILGEAKCNELLIEAEKKLEVN